MLIRLYIEEVLDKYEKAILKNFSAEMSFSEGVKNLWLNAFHYMSSNKHAFVLIQYGKSSPLLNKAYQSYSISEGQYFKPIRLFIDLHIGRQTIHPMPYDIYKAILFAPIFDLMQEYFDYQIRPDQIITEDRMIQCADVIIKGIMI